MKFSYIAKDASGHTIKGVVEAGVLTAAVQTLKEQNLFPISIREIKSGNAFSNLNMALGRVSSSDLANFTRQLSTMITAGLPITDALNLLKAQSTPSLSVVVAAVLIDVQSGLSLSSALSKHPKIFSKVYVSLVKAGEAAGVMEKVLNRLADNAEKSREFRAKVTGAMIYPVIILIGMIGVVILMMVVVIPKLTSLYKDFGAELPLATRMIMALSDYSLKYGIFIAIGVVVLAFMVKSYLKTEAGRYKADGMIYKTPVIGPLARQVMMTEMTRTMGLLVSAGVSVVESLNIVADSVGNKVVEKDVRRIAKQVEKGFPISISFAESPIFPPIVGQMIAVGEETGKLDDVLFKLSAYFESESGEKVKGLTTAIEPIILIILAIGVGFLMYAVVMPIYSITDQF